LRFVDASVFVYAFLKPRRAHAPHELEAKEAAKRIVRRINEGEKVVLTVAQLVEIANVPEKRMGEAAYQVERFLLHAPNVEVLPVGGDTCIEALKIAVEKIAGMSDAIAYVAMRQRGVREIYSFYSDFDRLEGIRRVFE
jgi:Predicted nucleic acid-binding protein, contains PIN domain